MKLTPRIIENQPNELSDHMRRILGGLSEGLGFLATRIDSVTREIEAIAA